MFLPQKLIQRKEKKEMQKYILVRRFDKFAPIMTSTALCYFFILKNLLLKYNIFDVK